MKNGQKYAKEINQMVNQEYFECSLWNIRNGKKASEDCRHVPESFDPVSGRDEFCKKCLCESLEWLNEEYKEQILNDDEKDIIKQMIDTILKFGCSIICVAKEHYVDGSFYISISYKNDVIGHKECITSPCFNNDKFKGMELEYGYTLEELGITCPTQKDN